jgi:hypothetical protein
MVEPCRLPTIGSVVEHKVNLSPVVKKDVQCVDYINSFFEIYRINL